LSKNLPFAAMLAVMLAFGLVVVGCDLGEEDAGGGLGDLFITGADQLEGKVDIDGRNVTIKSGQTVTLTKTLGSQITIQAEAAIIIVPSGTTLEGVEHLLDSYLSVRINQGGTVKYKDDVVISDNSISLDDTASYVEYRGDVFKLYGNATVAAGKTAELPKAAGIYPKLYLKDASVLVVKGTGKIVIDPYAELLLDGTSKLVLEPGGKVELISSDANDGHGGRMGAYSKDAGVYGGTAAAPDITKTHYTADRLTGGVFDDKLNVSNGGVTVFPGASSTSGGDITLGKTLYSVGDDHLVALGHEVPGQEATTPKSEEIQAGFNQWVTPKIACKVILSGI
jgi:hypothetical protein